ncbi:MAG: hypothetical protein V3V07_04240 [candidate division NC10 bacterium]|jgi:hypothetical protein|nr:hypothetical protein [candidate division NC10 bacterium]
MDRRTALAAMIAFPFLLVLAAGCEGVGSGASEPAQALPGQKQSRSVQEVILRIDGMT